MPVYDIRPKLNEELRLNVTGSSTAKPNQNINIYASTGSNDQKWFINEVGGKKQKILSTINQAYGLGMDTGSQNGCLQVTGGNDTTTSIEFEYVEGGCWRIKQTSSGLYLTCIGSTSGSNVWWRSATGGDDQVWRFVPTIAAGPQNYTYMTATYEGCVLHIIRTAASNIKLVNLKQKSLSGAGVYGINGGFFNPGTDEMLCIAKYEGAYLGPCPAPFNGSHNRTCGNGVIYRTANGQMFFVEGQDALTADSLAPVRNLTGQNTWAQGGVGMYLGWTDWIPSAEYLFGDDTWKMTNVRVGRTGFVVDNGTGFAYLIINNSAELSYIQFRQAIMTFLNLKDGPTPSKQYLGLILDGGSSTMLRAVSPQNTLKNFGGRAIDEAITLKDAT